MEGEIVAVMGGEIRGENSGEEICFFKMVNLTFFELWYINSQHIF